MINIPIADILTLIAGEVEKPVETVAGDDMGDASFLSFITGDPEFGQPGDMPDAVPDTALGRSVNIIDTPVARAMILSGMTGQHVTSVPAVEVLKQDDTQPVLNVSHEKTTAVAQPSLRIGLAKDVPANMPTDLSLVVSGVGPVLQGADVAEDVPRLIKETTSITPQLSVPDKQVNAAIFNDAPKLVPLPASPETPQMGSGSFQHNVMPPVEGMPRLHMPVLTVPDLVPSPPANTALPMTPKVTPKIVPHASVVDQQISGKQSRHTPIYVTETKENHRGEPAPKASRRAENSNAIIPPKVHTIATPPNQQPGAVNAAAESHGSQVVPASVQAPQASSLPAVDLPAAENRPILDIPVPRSAKVPKVLPPDNAQMPKAQNALPQHMTSPPADDMPNRAEPPQTQAPIIAPLQSTVLAPQSPKRQISKGQLPEPDVQPVKQTATSTPAQPTVPAVQPPITPKPDVPALEISQPDPGPELIPLETRAADNTSIARHDTITHRPEVGRHIAQQLTEAARQMPDRPVELTLNPDELGRVRLTFTMQDGGIHVAVIAERGETMDLMRRHIETLAQEFRDIGYKDVNFDFSRNGQGDSDSGDRNPDDPAAQTETSTETQTLAPVQLSLEPSTGLDLRL